MKRLFLIFVAAALPIYAEEAPGAQAYGYFGIMGSNGITYGKLLNPGFGLDGFVYRGLAAGADIGYVGYYNNFGSSGFGLFSPNVSYHFFNGTRVTPFVTGGYSLAFRSGTSSLGNYGGGITCWFSRSVGLRVEIRDHRDASGSHFTGTRFGVSFR
jgi:hypothetical protein